MSYLPLSLSPSSSPTLSTLRTHLATIFHHLSNPLPWTAIFLVLGALTITTHPSTYWRAFPLWWNAHLMAVARTSRCYCDEALGTETHGAWVGRYEAVAWGVLGVGCLGHVVDVGRLVGETAAGEAVTGWERGFRVCALAVGGAYLAFNVWDRRRRGARGARPYLFWMELMED